MFYAHTYFHVDEYQGKSSTGKHFETRRYILKPGENAELVSEYPGFEL